MLSLMGPFQIFIYPSKCILISYIINHFLANYLH